MYKWNIQNIYSKIWVINNTAQYVWRFEDHFKRILVVIVFDLLK